MIFRVYTFLVAPYACFYSTNINYNSMFFTPKGPVVADGVETWMMTKNEEQALLVFERKIFRRVYGPKYENGEWKIRTNREMEEMSKGENIVKWIKGQRISWLRHL
jgi:hypothetical protein